MESDENEEDLHFYSFNDSGNEFADEMKVSSILLSTCTDNSVLPNLLNCPYNVHACG